MALVFSQSSSYSDNLGLYFHHHYVKASLDSELLLEAPSCRGGLPLSWAGAEAGLHTQGLAHRLTVHRSLSGNPMLLSPAIRSEKVLLSIIRKSLSFNLYTKMS